MFTLRAFSLIKSFQLHSTDPICHDVLVQKSRKEAYVAIDIATTWFVAVCIIIMFAVVIIICIAINLDVQQETLCGDTSCQQPVAATKQQQETGRSQIQLSHFSKMNRYPDEYEAVREHLSGPGSNNMTQVFHRQKN